MSQHVLLVCQWYPPEPVDIPESIALALVEQGFEVSVLTGVPNYPTGDVRDGYSASRTSTEVIRDVQVHRTPLYPSHDGRVIRRLANYASWAFSSAALGQRRLRRADVALVYSSPATAALPAMVGKLLWGTPFVLLIQDVWPDSIFASGFVSRRGARFIREVVDIFVRRSYAMASHVAVISPGMIDLLAERGVPRSKLSVVYNWLPEATSGEVEQGHGDSLRDTLDIPHDARVFVYAGNHGRAQALDALVDAFSTIGSGTAHLVMVGAGVSKASLVERSAGNLRIHFLEPVARDVATRLMTSADATVVSLADEGLFAVTMPSKVQSGLKAGLPMLVVARGDAADVVERTGAGISAVPGDTSSIASAVLQISSLSEAELSAMGRAGAATYESLMSRKVGAPRLATILNAAAARHVRADRRTVAQANEGNGK